MNLMDLCVAIKADTSEYDNSVGNVKSSASSLVSGLSSTATKAAKVGFTAAAAAVGAATTAVATLTTKSVEAYADYEQLVGGVETLFGTQGMTLEEYAESIGSTIAEAENAYNTLANAQDTVMENASNAWKTAGLSANDYMESVTSFAAALKQSTSDEVEAAEKADIAVQDMADNANKMGTSMESIQTAYNGFAKQNYTMLDNLKLGYGGTKDEMERLLADAQEISGIEYDISNLSDVYDAIHVIQTELGITGTTSEEAMHTISGAASATKSAWENVITAIAGGGDLSEAMDGLITGLFGDGSDGSGLIANVIPRIQTVMEGIGEFVSKASPYITEYLPQLVESILPSAIEAISSLIGGLKDALPGILEVIWEQISTILSELPERLSGAIPGESESLLESAKELLGSIIQGIEERLPEILEKGAEIVSTVINGVTEMLPEIVAGGSEIITNLITGATEMLPDVLSAISEIMGSILSGLSENFPNLLDSGFTMISNLATGLLNNLPTVIESIGEIVNQLLNFLLQNMPVLLEKGVDLMINLALGIVDSLPEIIDAITQVITQLLATIVENLPTILEKGVEIVGKIIAGIIQAIPDLLVAAAELVASFGEAVLGTDWGEIGLNIITGIANGVLGAASTIVDAAKSVAESALKAAKDFLGIHSPSTVFRDQVGKMMALGMGVGVEDNAPTDTVEDTVNGLIEAAEKAADGANIPIVADVTTAGDDLICGTTDNQQSNLTSQMKVILEGLLDELSVNLTAPIYIGQEYLETIVLNAINTNNYRTGGR